MKGSRTPRIPATKLPHLRKKIKKNKVASMLAKKK